MRALAIVLHLCQPKQSLITVIQCIHTIHSWMVMQWMESESLQNFFTLKSSHCVPVKLHNQRHERIVTEDTAEQL